MKSIGNVEELHRQALCRFSDEAVTPGNFDLLDQLVAPEYIQHNPAGDLNLEQTKALLSALRGAFTNFKLIRELIVVEGDFAATRSTISGKFDRELPNLNGAIPPNGKPIELHIINAFRFDQDGKIAEEWAQFDNLSFLMQLGVMPSPAQ